MEGEWLHRVACTSDFVFYIVRLDENEEGL